MFNQQASEKLEKVEEYSKELSQLLQVYHSQERELHEMKNRLGRFMTKGMPGDNFINIFRLDN